MWRGACRGSALYAFWHIEYNKNECKLRVETQIITLDFSDEICYTRLNVFGSVARVFIH